MGLSSHICHAAFQGSSPPLIFTFINSRSAAVCSMPGCTIGHVASSAAAAVTLSPRVSPVEAAGVCASPGSAAAAKPAPDCKRNVPLFIFVIFVSSIFSAANSSVWCRVSRFDT